MLTKYVELLSRLTSLLQSVMESSEIATGVTKCYVDYSSTEKERVRLNKNFQFCCNSKKTENQRKKCK